MHLMSTKIHHVFMENFFEDAVCGGIEHTCVLQQESKLNFIETKEGFIDGILKTNGIPVFVVAVCDEQLKNGDTVFLPSTGQVFINLVLEDHHAFVSVNGKKTPVSKHKIQKVVGSNSRQLNVPMLPSDVLREYAHSNGSIRFRFFVKGLVFNNQLIMKVVTEDVFF